MSTDAIGALILHWDGQVWSIVEGSPKSGRELFAAWGSSATDVWAVGGFLEHL